jgi:hypothetical protein
MKLILITLVAVVVGMMVGCKAEPTPFGPRIPKEYAIELVKEALTERPSAFFPDGTGNCLDAIDMHERVSRIPAKWEAEFMGIAGLSWWQVTLTTTFKYTSGSHRGQTETHKPVFFVHSYDGGSVASGGHTYC